MPIPGSHLLRLVATFLLFFFLATGARADAGKPEGLETRKFSECNWLVTYRGRTYDLTPLTKGSFGRPLDIDLRTVMELYPEAKTHLDLTEKHTSEARAHAVIASGAILGAALTRLFYSNAKTSQTRINLNIVGVALSGFFLEGVYESWRSTRDAKEELAAAVDSFNAVSPYKIEPSGTNTSVVP